MNWESNDVTAGDARKLIRAAVERRRTLVAELSKRRTNAYRLFCGRREGIPGLAIDRYDGFLVFQIVEGVFELREVECQSIARVCLEETGARGIYRKRFVKNRSSVLNSQALYRAEPFEGETAPRELTVYEEGLHYLVRCYDGFGTGIFLDQRENRKRIAEEAAEARVLNCFSHTGAFSVAAAKAGAQVTSVDISLNFLNWSKCNFRVNGLDGSRHEFIRLEALSFLERASRRSDMYDLVIIDPPSFSRLPNGGVFSLRKDFGRLIRGAWGVLRPGGKIFFSCNLSSWTSDTLRHKIRQELGKSTHLKFLKSPPVPRDFSWEEHKLSRAFIKRCSTSETPDNSCSRLLEVSN